MQHSNTAGCILLKFYIKPQHTANVYNLLYVVSYRNSTSNHNFFSQCYGNLEVVSYRNSTSNHNGSVDVLPGRPVVSYRNSTSNHNVWLAKATHKRLYLIEILHQTTTLSLTMFGFPSCILSKFYIKPQLAIHPAADLFVVSYRNSTSNHNFPPRIVCKYGVVSYRNSTSNHN